MDSFTRLQRAPKPGICFLNLGMLITWHWIWFPAGIHTVQWLCSISICFQNRFNWIKQVRRSTSDFWSLQAVDPTHQCCISRFELIKKYPPLLPWLEMPSRFHLYGLCASSYGYKKYTFTQMHFSAYKHTFKCLCLLKSTLQ